MKKLFLFLLAATTAAPVYCMSWHSPDCITQDDNESDATQATQPIQSWIINVPVVSQSSKEETKEHVIKLMGTHLRFMNHTISDKIIFCEFHGSREEMDALLNKEPWFKDAKVFPNALCVELAGQK